MFKVKPYAPLIVVVTGLIAAPTLSFAQSQAPAPAEAPAPSATPAPAESSPASSDDVRPGAARRAVEWAQVQLQEMDAAIAEMEDEARDLQGDAKAKADEALDKLRETRDSFQQSVDEMGSRAAQWTSEQTARWENDIRNGWLAFETGTQEYFDAVGADLDLRREVFEARLDAQEEAFEREIDQLGRSARNAAAGARSEIEKRQGELRDWLKRDRERLENLGEATDAGWQTMVQGLGDAREAFQQKLEGN